MHDNTLARGLTQLGVDVMLTPTYTPIRTDEQDVSIDRVFFGGISVFLQQKIPLFRYAPSFVDRFLDQPWLIRLATARASEMSPKELGALTVSMLQGRVGRQRKEVGKLCRWLDAEARPDAILLSNMLIAGCVPAIKETANVPVLVTLQGDDIFLDDISEPYRSEAIAELRKLGPIVDGFIAHSDYYADHMASYLDIPREKIEVAPLGIDASQFERVSRKPGEDLAIGYLARLAPEKGLHNLVEAFIQIRQNNLCDKPCRLLIAGWLGNHNRPYAEAQFQRLRDSGLADHFEYLGSVDHNQKLEFLSRIDVLSVPTEYREPKGLFVLESLASGVPVVQPSHGAFPEVISRLQGGELYQPGDNRQLADRLSLLLGSAEQRAAYGKQGRAIVQTRHNAKTMAEQTRDLVERHIAGVENGKRP
jgi:glycosyltransferase involved in cell wall biosynthesis